MSMLFIVAIIQGLRLAIGSRKKGNTATNILMVFISEPDIQDKSNNEVEYEYCS